METYVVLRRRGWRDGDDLRAAAERSVLEGENTPDEVRWIRSYVLAEEDGEIIPVADTVIVRPDPQEVLA